MEFDMNFDVIIIGGGIVGVSTGLNILEINPTQRVLVIEKETSIGQHQTGNNSGVIHSGIYYKPGSLKAENCKIGYQKLLAFCEQNEIDYNLCGKIIVATNDVQTLQLDELFRRGNANGLTQLRYLSRDEFREIEPHAEGVKALHVPQTGIIDYSEVIKKYGECFQIKGGAIHCSETVISINSGSLKTVIETTMTTYTTKVVISCAGLMADRVAKMTDPEIPISIIPFRGEYYKLKKEREYLVKTLIYPVPDPAFPFLGVHFTKLIHGGVEAGPNAVLAMKREGYKKTDFEFRDFYETITWPGFQTIAKKYWKTGFGEFYRSFSKRAFVKALQQLLPEINESDLEVGGSGVRAQACSKVGGLIDDFLFVEHPNVIHVCNAPSPAATSSLAIGETVAKKALTFF